MLRSIVEQCGAGCREIMGFMLESNIEAGKQAWSPHAELAYGVSITDACLGWTETERLLVETAGALAARPEHRGAALA